MAGRKLERNTDVSSGWVPDKQEVAFVFGSNGSILFMMFSDGLPGTVPGPGAAAAVAAGGAGAGADHADAFPGYGGAASLAGDANEAARCVISSKLMRECRVAIEVTMTCGKRVGVRVLLGLAGQSWVFETAIHLAGRS